MQLQLVNLSWGCLWIWTLTARKSSTRTLPAQQVPTTQRATTLHVCNFDHRYTHLSFWALQSFAMRLIMFRVDKEIIRNLRLLINEGMAEILRHNTEHSSWFFLLLYLKACYISHIFCSDVRKHLAVSCEGVWVLLNAGHQDVRIFNLTFKMKPYWNRI
jgi:hypothetical protein